MTRSNNDKHLPIDTAIGVICATLLVALIGYDVISAFASQQRSPITISRATGR